MGEDTYAEILTQHHHLIRDCLTTHGGKEISTQGDGFFVVFSSPSACLAAAIEMQMAITDAHWPAGEPLLVRMGIHSGEATETTTTGLVGFGIHRAARVAAVAHGGQIIVSAAAAALVRDSLPTGVTVRDLGLHRLKDLGQQEQIFQVEAAGLRLEFPPLRSLDNPALANNLPAQSATFVGRAVEVAEVRNLVEANRLVTLTGAGGSGKTRLALQVAADLLDGSGDGVWLIELAPVTDEDMVALTIAESIGISGQAGRSALESLLDALETQRALIVLDNCEHLIGACAKVADAILRRCPRLHLMTTSREPLGIGGETIYRVPSLSLPAGEGSTAAASDAVALFLDRAAGQAVEVVLTDESAALIASICRRLDGMPLAIELAAARLRSMSLDNLHDRLDQRFRLLTGGSRSALPRQQTLRATVDWSYSLLNSPEQAVLRRLSVFAEGFDLEAAEVVCGQGDIELFDVTDLLGSLIDKSLVVAEPSRGAVRYRLLETIRQFSAERLVELDESEAIMMAAAHSAYFFSVAESATPHLIGPGQGQWVERLDSDQANLRRAMEHAFNDPDGTGRFLRFVAALRRYWWVRPRVEEVLGYLVQVLDRPETLADPELLGSSLVTAAVLQRSKGFGLAQQFAERAVETVRPLGLDAPLIDALWLLCATSYFIGDPATGLAYGEEAVALARNLGDDTRLGESLAMYLLCSQVITPERTKELFAEATACTDRSGDLFIKSVLENNAGVHALQAGEFGAARLHLEKAAEAARAIRFDLHNVPINLAWVQREEGDIEGARTSFEEGLRIGRRSGERSGIGYGSLGMACLATDLGEWHRAAVLHGVAQAFIELSGESWGQPEERYRKASIEAARAGLGDDEFQSSFAQGGALGPDEAFALALSRSPST